jgi:uncharacterized protein (TIGR03437 family)
MKQFSRTAVFQALGIWLTVAVSSAQQATVNLGSNSTFAILAGTTVTVTGGGSITGNIGISPGTAYAPGTPPVTLMGTLFAGGPVAAQAQLDLTSAYNDAAGRTLAPVTVAGNIGGMTLAPGLYKSTSSLSISSGDLTLDGGGNANAVWIFQIASTLTTTSGRKVILTGGANAANIFWQVGSSATIGTTSVFQGNILASVSISMLTGSTLTGRALASGGAVTVDTGGGGSATLPATGLAPNVISTLVSASYRSPVAAGSIAAVFGTNLSIGSASSNSGSTLPTTLAQSSFTIGSRAAPMFFAMPTQVNLQIPWEMAGQTQTSIIDTVNGASSNSQVVALATFAPGIFTIDASGAGQGAIVVVPSGSVAAGGTPALRNAYIAVFCTGLGAVSNQPATGAPALASPLSVAQTQPTITIGGVPSTVSFAGLAPGFAGLYQVNVLVPATVTPGSAVPVVLTIGAAVSNSVTIAVQ